MMNELQKLSLLTFDSYATKRVTYFLVTKNRARFLDAVFGCIRDLVGPDDELIVVDGASTDGAVEVIEKYRDMIDCFISEPDSSGAHGQNKAILLARGKYIKLLSDDDFIHREGMEQAIAAMERHPEIDMLQCGGTKEKNGKAWAQCVPPGVKYGKNIEDVFRYKGACGAGHMIRRAALAKLGILYPATLNGDVELVVRAIAAGLVVKFCRINMYHHPMQPESITVRRESEHRAAMVLLARRYCSRFFYVHYWFEMKGREYPRFRPAACFVTRVLRKLGIIVPLQRGKVIWDSGFS